METNRFNYTIKNTIINSNYIQSYNNLDDYNDEDFINHIELSKSKLLKSQDLLSNWKEKKRNFYTKAEDNLRVAKHNSLNISSNTSEFIQSHKNNLLINENYIIEEKWINNSLIGNDLFELKEGFKLSSFLLMKKSISNYLNKLVKDKFPQEYLEELEKINYSIDYIYNKIEEFKYVENLSKSTGFNINNDIDIYNPIVFKLAYFIHILYKKIIYFDKKIRDTLVLINNSSKQFFEYICPEFNEFTKKLNDLCIEFLEKAENEDNLEIVVLEQKIKELRKKQKNDIFLSKINILIKNYDIILFYDQDIFSDNLFTYIYSYFQSKIENDCENNKFNDYRFLLCDVMYSENLLTNMNYDIFFLKNLNKELISKNLNQNPFDFYNKIGFIINTNNKNKLFICINVFNKTIEIYDYNKNINQYLHNTIYHIIRKLIENTYIKYYKNKNEARLIVSDYELDIKNLKQNFNLFDIELYILESISNLSNKKLPNFDENLNKTKIKNKYFNFLIKVSQINENDNKYLNI